MENAVDALKIAFAMLVFVIAITTIFSVISQAKSTSDFVLFHSDKTNFYSHSESSDVNRVVTVAEVISTLYRYYKESVAVTIDLQDGNTPKTFDLSNEFAIIENIEEELKNYITDSLLTDNLLFTEEFVEVPISGIYDIGEDSTEIIKASGSKKLYITYTKNNH